MRKVFLSADDFGRSPGRNKAIDESFKQNLIRSAGLIVTGKHLKDAEKYVLRGGYVSKIHCHFNLSGNIKDEDSEDIPLTEEMKKDETFCVNGKFRSYTGLPSNFSSIFKFLLVYRELVAQYKKFIEVTGGKGNLYHVDFHLWYNLTWPVCIALNLFTWTHKIKSVRYIGVHQEHTRRRILRLLSYNPFVKSFRSSNIDGFISKPELFVKDNCFELYCHPDYIDDKLMDNSFSYYGHPKRLLETQISDLLQKAKDIEFVSWAEV